MNKRIVGLLLWSFLFAVFTAATYAQGNFIYTNNNKGVFPSAINTVSAFSVGSDGSLSEIPGSPFQTGG